MISQIGASSYMQFSGQIQLREFNGGTKFLENQMALIASCLSIAL